ncbi:hypothetical protein AJ80_07297 [Polytolypa hystricis UAMH7299]|uniref:Rhodopsin domain-containing protein n=1 Tax=Polytolypa hystricis (strain UAMH7299) TaxID=1447883 RepID=A0A2B7XQH5_POLH7|nr:hypothetical protein AJ80_07297 [Polytolypa hystricis UAMH7299]
MIECRPLHLFWDPAAHDHPCRKGKANLLSMATLNIATDVALILFPIPMLWRMRTLDFPAKLQLTLLFFAGTLVIIITITRVPLILNNKVAQTTRTFWACVEIICATIVANAAFYYALLKDSTKLRSCFSPRANPSSQLRMTGLSRRNFYNDSTPSGFASSGEPLSQYISEPATEGSAGPSEAPNFSRKLEFGKQNPSSIV